MYIHRFCHKIWVWQNSKSFNIFKRLNSSCDYYYHQTYIFLLYAFHIGNIPILINDTKKVLLRALLGMWDLQWSLIFKVCFHMAGRVARFFSVVKRYYTSFVSFVSYTWEKPIIFYCYKPQENTDFSSMLYACSALAYF